MKLAVHVLPRSSKNEIVGVMADGTLKIKVTAAPVDGSANKAVIRLLALKYKVPKSTITILRGQTGKNKIVLIEN